MKIKLDGSLIAKLTTCLRFESLEMMLWAWIIGQFLIDNYYDAMLL